jgi:hypothetical protein
MLNNHTQEIREYCEQAAHCVQQAEAQNDPKVQKQFLELAWLGPRLVRCNEMLAPSQPRSGLPQPRRLRETLLVSAVVIGIAAAGLVFLYLVTQGLLLAVHQFL